jgi:hypothetical protein
MFGSDRTATAALGIIAIEVGRGARQGQVVKDLVAVAAQAVQQPAVWRSPLAPRCQARAWSEGRKRSRQPTSAAAASPATVARVLAMLVTTGLLTIAGAVGLRQSLTGGPGRSWGPILVGIYGAALVAAGLLTADPAQGFPPGTPAGPPTTITWHGLGHLVAGGIGFLCLIARCYVFARRFSSQGASGWAIYSTVTGVAFLAGFAGIASGNQVRWLNLAFGAAVVTAWAWVSAVCARTSAKRS